MSFGMLQTFKKFSHDVLRLNEVTKSDRNLWWGY